MLCAIVRTQCSGFHKEGRGYTAKRALISMVVEQCHDHEAQSYLRYGSDSIHLASFTVA